MTFAQVRRGILVAAAMVGAIALTVFVARTWQQRHVQALLTRTLAVPWETLQTTEEPFADSVLRNGVPVPAWDVAYATNREEWSSATLFRVPPPKFASEAVNTKYDLIDTSYLQVEIGGPNCETRTVLVGVKYTGVVENFHKEFTRVFKIQRDADRGTSRLLFPVFYEHGPSWTRFDGFAVPKAGEPCITAVKRAVSTGSVPLPILFAVLAPNWMAKPLYQQMTSDAF